MARFDGVRGSHPDPVQRLDDEYLRELRREHAHVLSHSRAYVPAAGRSSRSRFVRIHLDAHPMKTNQLARLGNRLLRKIRGDAARFPWQWSTNTDHSYPYLTGNGIATYCRHILNFGRYRINSKGRENW